MDVFYYKYIDGNLKLSSFWSCAYKNYRYLTEFKEIACDFPKKKVLL